ncbi:hypothetical protein CQW23_10648 [Capsicum baccatum]|uniref:Ubiquitin-like protease family profile domain-containing protein n=1 Tax=Capsicum baccatum TaxID=33114 RepID=A0A2G2X0D2_CAPBA|nr:hypothetical protein CQW23_10648 [Capsicum baccatum]
MKEGKQTSRVIFPQIQSKVDSHIKEVAVSKRESHVEKETFISKNFFDAFREEVRQEFKGVREEFTRIRQLMKKKFKKMVKAIEHSKQQHEDTEVEAQQMVYDGVETSPQQFSPTVDQNLYENQDGTKGCTDLDADKINIEIDSQYLIPDELLQSINLDYNLSEKIVYHDDRITDEKLDDTNLSDSQFTISDDLLLSLNVYRRESITRHPLTTSKEEQIDEHFNDKNSKSIIVHPSANRELQTPIPKLRIRRPSKFKESLHDEIWFSCRKGNGDHYKRGESTIPMKHFGIETVEDKNWFYTMGFPDQSWTDSSKYDPNRSYKFSTVDCNFMNIIRSVHDVYSADAENLTVEGHVAHLNEYINKFRMHAAVPWHTVKDIYIPVNIKEKHHWVLSFSERYIFLYDSHESSGHYSAVLDVIEKLAAIIPLCLKYCDFYVKKGIHVENHPRYKDKDSSDMFDVLFQESLPQQPSGSLDCGVYMVTYAECLSYGHKILANEFDPNALRTRYVVLLWDYGTRKQDVNAHSDVEAPLRPIFAVPFCKQ